MRLWAPVFLALAASACSNAPVRIESRALADQLSRSPDHFIIAAVDNEPSAFVARAGSTPRGYDSIADYGPSAAARKMMRALENDYGLREVSAWPIDPLHMHCAVLEVPEGTDRYTILAALAHDRRIRQAQLDADAAHCNSFTLARALVAAFDAHAQIVNLSLAGPADPLLTDLIREGLRRGVLFVGAAPADVSEANAGLLHQPGVIEVASTGNQSVLSTALYAPGREILTLLPGGHYDFASGDSIATAQVTGVLALLLAKKTGLSAADAYRLLRNTSAHPAGAGGGGFVDACAAVVALVGH